MIPDQYSSFLEHSFWASAKGNGPEELCFARVNGNPNLLDLGIHLTEESSDGYHNRLLDVPCGLELGFICAIEIPSSLENSREEMRGEVSETWPNCIWKDKRPVKYVSC